MHCITILRKMLCPQLSAALQDRFAAGLYHCSYTYEDLLFMQVCSETLFRAKSSSHCSVQLCKTGLPQVCVDAFTPVKICCLYRCAVKPIPVHCTTILRKMQCPQLSAALEGRLSAGLYHCNHTSGDLLFTQVRSEPNTSALQHCSGQNAVRTAQCCSARQACSRLVSLQLHL
jgi:hypothetical protein